MNRPRTTSTSGSAQRLCHRRSLQSHSMELPTSQMVWPPVDRSCIPPTNANQETQQALDESRSISEHAIAVLALLNKTLPIHKAKDPSDPILALASFTSTEDPWTTADSFANATAALQSYSLATGSENEAALRSTLQQILKEKIRPLFTRTRNPAITGAGRRNFHPVPLARFDASILDDEARPWKGSDLYASAVLAWIMAQYPVCIAFNPNRFIPPCSLANDFDTGNRSDIYRSRFSVSSANNSGLDRRHKPSIQNKRMSSSHSTSVPNPRTQIRYSSTNKPRLCL